MAAKSHKLGPGSLKFGATGSEVEFATRCRSVAVEPEVEESDRLPVLSGDEVDDVDSETYNLTGSVFQDYDLDSLLVWTHVNAGKTMPFVFRPDNDKALGVKGEVKIKRLRIGGDVKERNESDFEFRGVNGMYDLYDLDGVEPQVPLAAWTEDPANDDTPPADDWT